MTKTYIEWIEDKIEIAEREVAKLTIAREVLALAVADIERSRGKAQKQPQLPKPAKAKRNSGPPPGKTRAHILEAMRTIGKPALSGTIYAETVAAHPEVTRKQVHNALYNMSKVGAASYDPKTRFYAAERRPAEAAGSAEAA